MSKRFGRNQRRKCREQIQNLQTAYKRESALIERQGKELSEAKESLSNIVKTVESICKHSAAIPAKEIISDIYYDNYQMLIQKPFNPTPYSEHATVDFMPTKTIVNLYALDAYIREHIEEFSKAVHLKFNGRHEAYMISEHALRTMDSNEISKYLMPRIIDELITQMKKNVA